MAKPETSWRIEDNTGEVGGCWPKQFAALSGVLQNHFGERLMSQIGGAGFAGQNQRGPLGRRVGDAHGFRAERFGATRIGVAEKILLKILLKQNPRLTLSRPEINISVPKGKYRRWLIDTSKSKIRTRAKR